MALAVFAALLYLSGIMTTAVWLMTESAGTYRTTFKNWRWSAVLVFWPIVIWFALGNAVIDELRR